MPLATAITSTLFICYAGLTIPALGVAFAMLSISPDIAAIIGAVFAGAISLIYSLRKDHSIGNTICVIISSGMIGGLGPGFAVDLAILCKWITPETANSLTWKIYTIAGFILGLGAWALVQAMYRLWQRGAEKAEAIAQAKLDQK